MYPTYDFLNYLAAFPGETSESSTGDHLPSLNEISKELGVSVASLREQLEVARALGFVDVRPRTGTRRLPYSFFPAVSESLTYAIALDPSNFEAFSQLRNQVEAAFYREAVGKLLPGDIQLLKSLLNEAWKKLNGTPVQIPHNEHKQLHMTIFQRLGNPFVTGIVEAFWEAYEAVGLNMYADYAYLHQVWGYHQEMVDNIADGDIEGSYAALVTHKDLLHHRPNQIHPNPGLESDRIQPFIRKEIS